MARTWAVETGTRWGWLPSVVYPWQITTRSFFRRGSSGDRADLCKSMTVLLEVDASGSGAVHAMTAALALALMGLELGLRLGERNGLRPAATDDLTATDLRLAGIVGGRNRLFGTAPLSDELRFDQAAALDPVTKVLTTDAAETLDVYDLMQVCSPIHLLTFSLFFLWRHDWVIPAFGPWLAA